MSFTRAELESALAHYSSVVQECSRSGDWAPFADLFTEDVHYVEHAYGELHGREAVREWIQTVMAPFPHMRFPQGWTAYDDTGVWVANGTAGTVSRIDPATSAVVDTRTRAPRRANIGDSARK